MQRKENILTGSLPTTQKNMKIWICSRKQHKIKLFQVYTYSSHFYKVGKLLCQNLNVRQLTLLPCFLYLLVQESSSNFAVFESIMKYKIRSICWKMIPCLIRCFLCLQCCTYYLSFDCFLIIVIAVQTPVLPSKLQHNSTFSFRIHYAVSSSARPSVFCNEF